MILVVLEHNDGIFKKSALEAASFASNIASETGSKLVAIALKGVGDFSALGSYGVEEVYQVEASAYLDSQQWVSLIKQASTHLNPAIIVLSNNSLGKSIGGRLSVSLNLGLISNVVDFKMEESKLCLRKTVFSGKAFAWYTFSNSKGIISVMPKGYGVFPDKNKQTEIKNLEINLPLARIKLIEKKLIKGKMPLTEADIVVSAGRGLKESSNWAMVEELAEILNAATACSRPVADAGWRPHHEHVGQTGKAIRPNVYIAIGISGAIQHLAGVNNSKTIIVINKDPEAPFFKAADYGICGDLFDIVPKLNEALKKLK